MFMPQQPSFFHGTGFACVPHCRARTEKVRQTLLLHEPLWELPGVGVGCKTEVRPGCNGERNVTMVSLLCGDVNWIAIGSSVWSLASRMGNFLLLTLGEISSRLQTTCRRVGLPVSRCLRILSDGGYICIGCIWNFTFCYQRVSNYIVKYLAILESYVNNGPADKCYALVNGLNARELATFCCSPKEPG
jgi:hypothetical protein